MPLPAILLLVQGIQAAINAAPQIEKAVTAAKDFVVGLFGSGAITKAQQDLIHAQVDAVALAVQSGHIPPEFTIEPDPQ